MIEETVRVVETRGEFALVELIQRKSACGACSAQSGCGTSALSKVLGQRPLQLRAQNPIGARAGETVIVGLADEALVRGSIAVYLVPLLAMLTAALLGEAVAPHLGGGEGLIVALGLAGLALGFGWVRFFASRAARDPRYRAVLLRPVRDIIPIQIQS